MLGSARHLLKHCSGGDALMGSAPMWLSVIIIALIGFVVGGIFGFLAALHCQRKGRRHAGPEIQIQHNEPLQDIQVVPRSWLPSVLRFKRSNPNYINGTGRGAGPLGNGLQSASLLGEESASQSDWGAAPDAVSGPSTSQHPLQDLRLAANAAGHEDSDQQVIPIDAILGRQNSLVREGSAIKAYTGGDALVTSQTGHHTHISIDAYEAERGIAKNAQKLKDASAVGDSYEWDELDDEWKELLDEVDGALMTVHSMQMDKETMNSQERAVAIRTLLVATAREKAEAAILHAVQDVQRFRRIQPRPT